MADDLMLQVGIGVDIQQALNEAKRAGDAIGSSVAATASSSFNKKFSLGRITGNASEFQKSLEASNARVVAFGASAGAIYALKASFDKLLSSTIEVEKALKDINSLFHLGAGGLQNFSNTLFQIANQSGVSFKEASKAALAFAQHGLSVENTLKRTAAALNLSRISALGFSESISAITSIINSFNKEALDAQEVVDKLAAVSGRFAASADEISEALSRVGASASDANVSLDETIGLITAAQQVTARGGAVIGNSLSTIFTRLQRPVVLEDLETAGIRVKDLQGKMLPLMDILKNVAQSYDTLSSGQKSFVAETIGGVRQVNILKAILQDLGAGVTQADIAMQTAGNSAGATQRRFAELNTTISTELIRTMNDLTKVAYQTGNALFSGPIRQGLTQFRNVIGFIDSATDKNKAGSEGTLKEQVIGNTVQGTLKGVSNIIAGPGIQFGVVLLSQLFKNLERFLIDSAKAVTGLSNETRKEEVIQESINRFLATQPDLINQILSGQIKKNELEDAFLAKLKEENQLLQLRTFIATNIAKGISSEVQIKNSASGFIPNLFSFGDERAQARQNGYIAGKVVGTTISNGLNSVPVVANTAESITRVRKNGKDYDFVNPVENSPAGRRHMMESIAKTGINPYAVQDAMNRENRATHGNAKLDIHPLLITPENPLGLVAIDKKNQHNASDAIAQHLGLGQTLSEIRQAHTAALGRIPNLATAGLFDSAVGNSLFLGLANFGANSYADNQVSKQRELVNEYNRLVVAFATGAETQAKFNGAVVRSSEDLKALSPEIERAKASISNYEKEAIQRQKVSSRGFKTAIGASFAGGLASQVVGRFSPTGAAAVDNLTTGLSNYGQAQAAFPGRVGTSIGVGLLAVGVANAFDTLVKSLEKAHAEFDAEQTKNQKLLSNLDTLTNSLSAFDTLIGDAHASTSTLIREQRRYSEALSQLSANPRGQEIAAKLNVASNSRERLNILDEYRGQVAREQNRRENILAVAEYAGNRSFRLPFGVRIGGNGLGGSNLAERTTAEELIKGTSSSLIADTSDTFKQALIDSSSSLSAFKDTIDKFAENDTTAKAFQNSLGSVKESGGQGALDLIIQQLRADLGREGAINDPTINSLRTSLVQKDALRQAAIDDAQRREDSTRRLFINQGSLRAGNSIDIADLARKGTFNAGLEQLTQREGVGRFLQLSAGERTVKTYEAATDVGRIETERQNNVNNLISEQSRGLATLLTQTFDKNLGKTENLNAVDKGQYVNSLGESTVSFIDALNKGLGNVFKETNGNLGKFTDKNGGFNYDAFSKAVVEASGADNTLQGRLKSYLASNNSDELLKNIYDVNTKIADINEGARHDTNTRLIELNSSLRELDFKQLSSFLGGITNLLDRNARRNDERELVRSTTLLEKGATPEQRAVGAAGVLKYFQKNNVPIDQNNPLIKEAFSVGVPNFSEYLSSTFNRISGNLGRTLGSESAAVAGFNQYGQANLTNAAQAAFSATFKPENAQITGGANADISKVTSTIKTELDSASTKVKSFGESLLTTAQKLKDAVNFTLQTRTNAEEARKVDYSGLIDAMSKILKEKNTPENAKAPSSTNYGAYISSGAGIALGVATGVVQFLQFRRQGQILNTLATNRSAPHEESFTERPVNRVFPTNGNGNGTHGVEAANPLGNGRATYPARSNGNGNGNGLGGYRETVVREPEFTEAPTSPRRSVTVPFGTGAARPSTQIPPEKFAPELYKYGPFIPMTEYNDRDFEEQYQAMQRRLSLQQGFYKKKNVTGLPASAKRLTNVVVLPNVPAPNFNERPEEFVHGQYVGREYAGYGTIKNPSLPTPPRLANAAPINERERRRSQYRLQREEEIRARLGEITVPSGETRGGLTFTHERYSAFGHAETENVTSRTVVPTRSERQLSNPRSPNYNPNFNFRNALASEFGHNASSIALQVASQNARNPFVATGLDIASNFTPQLARFGRGFASKLPGVARFLPALGGAALAEGGGIAGAGAIAGAVALPAALIAAGTYGAYRGERKLLGLDKITDSVTSGLSEHGANVTKYVNDSLSKGKDVNKLIQYVQGQLNSDVTSKENLHKGFLGSFGNGAIDTSLSNSIVELKNTLVQLEQIKEGQAQQKEDQAQQTKTEEFQQKFLAALTNIGKGGDGDKGSQHAFQVTIDLKNSQNVPEDVLEKVVNPLKHEIEVIWGKLGTPRPAKV